MNETLPSKHAAPDKPDGLPLWKAAVAWCDPTLVDSLLTARAEYVQVLGGNARENPFPTAFDNGFIAQMAIAAASGIDMGPRKAAGANWMYCVGKVTKDLRERIVTGEITLTGLQTKPRLKSARSVVPSAWAELLTFDWSKNSVQAADVTLTSVLAERRLDSSVSKDACAEPPLVPNRSPTDIPRTSRGRGRTDFRPMIEADLRANWDKVQQLAARNASKKPVWTELAKIVEKRLIRAHPGNQRSIPHVEIIRTRLPELYLKVLSDMPVR
jgi:hypothetical protein